MLLLAFLALVPLDRDWPPRLWYGVRSSRAALALLIVALVIGLTPAAYADPPDPTWIAGCWDDDDFDNAVVFIVSVCALDVPSPPACAPLFLPVARVHSAETVYPAARLSGAVSPRPPPLAAPPHC
jgi:hypothetical protein